jgi:hypothetical protein
VSDTGSAHWASSLNMFLTVWYFLFFILLPLNFNVLFTLRYCQQLFQLQLNLSISKDEKTINCCFNNKLTLSEQF